MANRTIVMKASDKRDFGITSMAVQVKLQLKGETAEEMKKTTEMFRDRLFALVNEFFYVSEIKQ